MFVYMFACLNICMCTFIVRSDMFGHIRVYRSGVTAQSVGDVTKYFSHALSIELSLQ